ncbi:Phosphoesterase, PA-phosphatase related protein [Syntrophobacter sp. SbD1]|nr:Phosphoesterase, PA-phosphatase related protein [Syntrophobacter sp. SbD1]
MRWKKILGSTVICAAMVIAGCFYLDIRLAEFVSEKVGFKFLLSERVANLPDLLFWLVCMVAIGSWTGWLYLTRKQDKSWNSDFFTCMGSAVPLAYIFKEILKDLFGRTNTRFWLLHPNEFGFHWFHGGGAYTAFPSGHMAVFTALMLGVTRYYPRLRPVCAGLLLLLALALLVTQYHFFSDIVAGAYLGMIVELLACRLSSRQWSAADLQSSEKQ